MIKTTNSSSLFLFLTITICLVSPIFAGQAFTSINTGKITPVTSFSGNLSASAYTYTITHTIGATPEVALSLISFESIVSTTFSFNLTILSISSTQIVLSIQTYSTTYFKSLSYHYLLQTLTSIEVNRLCYYTSNLLTGTGTRSQTFNNATTAKPETYMTLVTVLTGMKITNTNGSVLVVKVVSNKLSLPVINTVVSTEGNNLVQWVCVSLIVYAGKTGTGQFYTRRQSSISYTSQFTGVLSTSSAYQLVNTMFFGLSYLNLWLNYAPTINFQMYSGSTTPLSGPIFNQNIGQMWLQQFYIWYDTCITTPGNVVPSTGTTCATSCASTQYVNAAKYCVPCSAAGKCLTCIGADCATCDNVTLFRVLYTLPTPDICICMPGYFENTTSGLCQLCNTTITNCDICSSSTFCTTCQTNYTATAAGICVCNPGTYLINNTCVPLMGCLNFNFITSGYMCTQCDTANYFQKLVNYTCQCMNNTVYNVSTGMCQGTCGDGVSLGNHCDLGAALNGVNGSGCSSTCTTVNGYYCSNPSTTTPSICVVKRNFNGQYLYAQRDLTSNTAIFYIKLTPKDPKLQSFDFSQTISTSIPTDTLTATYSPQTQLLTIKAQYTSSIQATYQMLNISFDYTKVYAPSIIIYTTTEGVNARLQFGVFQAYNGIVYYMGMFVGGLGFGIALVSAVLGYKLIGFEIVLPLQVAYFALMMLAVPQASISSLYGLSLSYGYNTLTSFSLSNNLNANKGLIVLQRQSQFLQNVNYTYIPLLLLFIAAGITKLWVKQPIPQQVKKGNHDKKKKQQKNENKQQQVKPQQQVSTGQKAHHFIVDRLLVSLWIILMLNVIFSFGVQMQSSSDLTSTSTTSTFPLTVNIAVGIGMFILALACMAVIVLKVKDKDKKVTFRSYSKYYPIIYITMQLISIFLITFLYTISSLCLFTLFLPQLIIIIFYIKLSPHNQTFKSFLNITGLYLQLIPSIAIGLYLVNNYVISSMFGTVSAFGILGLFLIGEGLSIARLVLRYRNDKMRMGEKEDDGKDKVRMEAENLEAMTYSSIKNQLINNSKQGVNWENMNQEEKMNKESREKQSPSKLAQYQKIDSMEDSEQEDKGEDEIDQLKRLKMRLRKQIYEKRNFDL